MMDGLAIIGMFIVGICLFALGAVLFTGILYLIFMNGFILGFGITLLIGLSLWYIGVRFGKKE